MSAPELKQLPKALLHDHLDGGLRIATILELADEHGYGGLPSTEPETLRLWFHQRDSGSLEEYLLAFDQTIAVMQTAEALERVAYEAVVDLAADGVVYVESRFGPSLHLERGLLREDVIEAVGSGLNRGSVETGCVTAMIASALRDKDDSEKVAEAAVQFVGQGVVGFDLAGPEAGHPADAHLAACLVARQENLGLTIHGGEGDGAHSIWRARAMCAAQRIGHGVRVIDETVSEDGEIVALGSLARALRDQRVPLEVAITSNLDTGMFPDAAHHPFGALYRAGFAVTLNTDNRLMSDITLTDEYEKAAAAYELTMADLGQITETALLAGFSDWETRRRLIEEVVRPAYGVASSAAP